LNITEIANGVVKDVQNRNHKSAAGKIQVLLDSNADLEEKWGGITRLAVTIGEFKQAKVASQKFLEVAPHEPKRIIQSAAILAEIRDINAAIALVKPLLDKQRTPQVLHFLGTTYSQIGQIDLAKNYLSELLTIAPNSEITWLTFASIYKFEENDNFHKKLISISNVKNISPPYWFALGKSYLDVKNYKLAFESFNKGCESMNKNSSYNYEQHKAFVDNIIEHQDEQYIFNPLKQKQSELKAPIFILGLPRAGTTLLQQILSSHSEIGMGGETRCLSFPLSELGQNRINTIKYQSNEEQQATFDSIRENYFYYLEQQYEINLPIVDKTLNLNHHVGTISKSFPDARLIRITRNKKDNAWSCFRTFFSQGVSWSYSLGSIAEFFYQEERLASHWSNLLSERILEISYEDLISKPEEVITQCLNHLGMDYEEHLMNFYKSEQLVQTASVEQVRHPINTKSIGSANKIKEQLNRFSEHYKTLNKTP